MSKYFRPWNIDQTLLLPPNVQDFVPKGHVSRFIIDLVRESLELEEITGSYVSGPVAWGQLTLPNGRLREVMRGLNCLLSMRRVALS
jgi:hypothetical protein